MNNLRLLFYSLIFFLLTGILLSCNEDFEDYSTSPGDILSFSTDTLSFDTILTTVNTPILQFMVYNKNEKPLLISSIDLTKADESGFKINVDGVAGNHFENVRIGAKDSLFVYVNVKASENGQVTPVVVNDYVVFTTNNTRQEIVLEAYGQDVYRWKGVVLESDTTLENDKPYLIHDSLEIKEGVTLTLKEGTTLYMHGKADIIIRGTIKAVGTLQKPVTIRGDRTDYMLNIPYDRVPGQWGGIHFSATSYDNEMEYTHIRNGVYGMNFELSDPGRSKLKLKNSILTNVSGPLVHALNCNIEAENCEFSNSKEALLYLAGGKYSFIHCTLANYYMSAREYGWGNSDNGTLVLSNIYYPPKATTPEALPLQQADFYNTIIWGLKPTAGSGIALATDTIRYPDVALHYHFHHCVIPNKGSNDEDFVSCIFNQDPKFMNTKLVDNDSKSIPYDFRIDSISPARDVADPEIARKIPYDLNGISRFLDKGPDMGGYEYQKSN